MYSKTGICNIALQFLGARTVSGVVDDDNSDKNSRACSIMYDPSRRLLLEGYAWTFARKRAVLSRLSETPAFGWDYQFTLPADCLLPYKVNDQLNEAQQPLWDVEGRNLLTNEDEANLIYVFDEDNATVFTPGFITALALLIAANSADTIKQDKGKTRERMLQMHQFELGRAMTADANKGFEGIVYDANPWNDSWIKARG